MNFNSDIFKLSAPSYSKICSIKSMKEIKQKHTNEAFLHSIAHIEYSAIDIALDACYRFRNLPMEYYLDWLEVANDEIRHFKMISDKMESLGVRYGDYIVHDGLFIALIKTQNSLINRMAILPRYMEANGLDANLFMMENIKSSSLLCTLWKNSVIGLRSLISISIISTPIHMNFTATNI